MWFISFSRKWAVDHNIREMCALCGSPMFVFVGAINGRSKLDPRNLIRVCRSCLDDGEVIHDVRPAKFVKDLRLAIKSDFLRGKLNVKMIKPGKLMRFYGAPGMKP